MVTAIMMSIVVSRATVMEQYRIPARGTWSRPDMIGRLLDPRSDMLIW